MPMTPERKALKEHITEIVNGRFRPWQETVGIEAPLHCASFSYNDTHPLKVSAKALGTALAVLLSEDGRRHAGEKGDGNDGIYTKGLPLLAHEFLVAWGGAAGGAARVDILAKDSALHENLRRVSADDIDSVVDATLNAYKLTC